MKKLSLVIKILCLSIGLFIFRTSNATIWRVNNGANSNPNFTTIQAAIDSDLVLAGDTLMIEGSSDLYQGFNLDKRLVVIGSGYFLSENPQTSVNGAATIIDGGVDFNEGSDGSVLQGVLFDGSSSSDRPRVRVDNVLIGNCYLTYGVEVDTRITGLVVIGNYFNDGLIYHSSTSDAMQGTIFRNNIVVGDFIVPSTDADIPRNFSLVSNNLFLADVQVTTSVYRNNIWLPLQSSTINVTAGIKEYNLNVSVDMGAANNNQVISGLTDLYSNEGSKDGKWQIKEDSAYKNAGKDGTDPGPFGGSNPYVLSGVPAIPVIYEISTTGFGSTEEGLPVTIKVRSN